MTTKKTVQMLLSEVNKLNLKIDKKIVLGQDYVKESKQHKDLVLALDNIKQGIYA